MRMSLIERQEKVPIETMIITATSAAIGMIATSDPSTSSRNSRNTPETMVESRVSPPDFTLMTDWPIIAQPPMPPRKPVKKLAMPWPFISRCLSEPVSVRSSTICAVSIDSSRPTAAIVAE